MNKRGENTQAPPAGGSSPVTFSVYLGMALCVFVAGAAVMIYEFLAIRILARFFGSTMDVWASEIAVCLAGLSLGYFVGGLIADRFRALWPTGVALIAAGVSALFMEKVAVWWGERLLHVEAGLQWHPLIAAGASSFIPLLALGTVLPQAVRMAALDKNRVGAAAGYVAALSTIGSIVGVLAIGHYLLLHWPVLHVLYGLSVLLIVLGALLTAGDIVMGRKRAALVLVLCVAALPAYARTVLFQQYTAHNHVLVVDERGIRGLLFDNDVQSTMSLLDPYAGGLEYTDYFHVPMVLNPSINRVYFVGLGGGTGPKAFLRDYPHVSMDVSEIDPVVEQVARHYFHLPRDPRLNVVTQDGRVFLNRGDRTYGAIIVDAYASGPYGAYIPAHLATKEFFELARNRLDNGGSLVFNAIGVFGGMNHNAIASLLSTLRATFPAVYVYQAATSVNTVFVAVKLDQIASPEALPKPWPGGPYLQHPAPAQVLSEMAMSLLQHGFLRAPALPQRFYQVSAAQGSPSTAPVLTDNYAPVDVSPGRR